MAGTCSSIGCCWSGSRRGILSLGCFHRRRSIRGRNRSTRPPPCCCLKLKTDGSDHIVDVDQVEAIEPAVRSDKPGRYHVDQIERDPLPSGAASRRWGVAIKPHDGSVELQPERWEA